MGKPCQEFKGAIGWCTEEIEELNVNIMNMEEKLVNIQEVEIEN